MFQHLRVISELRPQNRTGIGLRFGGRQTQHSEHKEGMSFYFRTQNPRDFQICFVGTIPPNGLVCNVNEVIERLTKRKDNLADTQFVARPKQITV